MKKSFLSVLIVGLALVYSACNSLTETVTLPGENATVTETATATITARPTTTIITITTSEIAELNQGQAFAIAAKLVPTSVLGAERIVTVFSDSPGPHRIWITSFSALRGYLTTKQELLSFGWQADSNTTFGDTDSYARVEIGIDAETGEVTHKTAFNGYYIGGLPGIS